MNFAHILFHFVWIIHIIFWIYIITSPFLPFSNVWKYNIYYVVPLVYMIHILPFHVLCKTKDFLIIDEKEKKNWEHYYTYNIPGLSTISQFREHLQKNCTFSPFSPQGMLLFCLIISVYRLYPCKNK